MWRLERADDDGHVDDDDRSVLVDVGHSLDDVALSRARAATATTQMPKRHRIDLLNSAQQETKDADVKHL